MKERESIKEGIRNYMIEQLKVYRNEFFDNRHKLANLSSRQHIVRIRMIEIQRMVNELDMKKVIS